MTQLFDPEKRTLITTVSDLKKTIEDLKQIVNQKEKQRETDQRTIESIYRELSQEEENHRKTKESITQLKEEFHKLVVTPNEDRYNELKRKHSELQQQNQQLNERLDNLSMNQVHEQQKLDLKVRDLHRSLSSLMNILDTTNMAIIHTKTSLEAVRPLLSPQNEQTPV
jgi:chromosome segregation ATPase